MSKTKLLLFIICLSYYTEGKTQDCISDSSCRDMNYCNDGICVHKNLFPLEMIEYIGSALMTFISIIANAGGVGGSSITISILLLMFNFSAYEAIPLAQVFVFSGVFTTIIIIFNKRHHFHNKPLIYYDLIMLICCPLLMGVSIGVILNRSFPE